MNTISAKELRDNMDEIVQRVRRGEAIKVTYRSKPAFTLQPEVEVTNEPEPGSPEAMELFIKSAGLQRSKIQQTGIDPNVSAKDLYHAALNSDPKHKPPYQQ